jgi:hypothetical protein
MVVLNAGLVLPIRREKSDTPHSGSQLPATNALPFAQSE